MKLVIVGGVAGGASAAARARRLSEDAEIVMFERGAYISFANCGLPYHLGGAIPERSNLLVISPEDFRSRANVDVRIKQEVTAINRDRHTVSVTRLEDGSTYEETYDNLIIATGAIPLQPPVPGADGPDVYTLWTMADLDRLMARIADARRAVVLGAGFVGVEAAENLRERGLEVHLVDMEAHVLKTLDTEMARYVEQELRAKGVVLHLGCVATAIHRQAPRGPVRLELSSDESIESDFIVMSAGVRPRSELAAAAGLELSAQKGIRVDECLRTSDPAIFAIGDVAAVTDLVTGQPALIPLAGPANRQGRIAADVIFGRDSRYPGSLGTNVVRVFGVTAASVGRTAEYLAKSGIAHRHVYLHPSSNARYYPGAELIHLKLLFDEAGRILGAQAVGRKGVEKQIDVIATAMRAGMTVHDLEGLELAYAPPYGSAKSPVNFAGMLAANALRGDTTLINPDAMPEDAFLLDVRQPAEAEVGSIPGSTLIPLGEVRRRLDELPKDRLVIVYCQVGLRGYVAERILRQHGLRAANLNGGWDTWRQFHAPQAAAPRPLPAAPRPAAPAGTPASNRSVDVRALQCPGPIVRVRQELEAMAPGEVLGVRGGGGFCSDLQAWCASMGHDLLSLDQGAEGFTASIRKGGSAEPCCPTAPARSGGVPESACLVVFSNDLDRVMAAFIIATGLASLGVRVSMFFTFWGLSVLRRNPAPAVSKDLLSRMFGWMLPRGAGKLALSKMHMLGMGTAMMKHVMNRKNVSSLPELVTQARQMGIRFVACDMAMDVMGLRREELLDAVDDVAGVASFAAMTREAGTTLFI